MRLCRTHCVFDYPRFLDALQLDVYRQLLDLPGFSLEQAYVIAALFPMLLDHKETHQRLDLT